MQFLQHLKRSSSPSQITFPVTCLLLYNAVCMEYTQFALNSPTYSLPKHMLCVFVNTFIAVENKMFCSTFCIAFHTFLDQVIQQQRCFCFVFLGKARKERDMMVAVGHVCTQKHVSSIGVYAPRPLRYPLGTLRSNTSNKGIVFPFFFFFSSVSFLLTEEAKYGIPTEYLQKQQVNIQ